LLVAPSGLKDRLFKLIEREIQNHTSGLPAHIILKVNGLEDTMMCRALHYASRKGVRVDLIVRGICCLRPTYDDSKESKQVIPQVLSVVSRFLEHSRVFYFRNAQQDPVDGEMFISSADLMYRNLHRRVEVAVPILDRYAREKCWETLTVMTNDSATAWQLQPDGSYLLRNASASEDRHGSQESLMKIHRERSRGSGSEELLAD
jgi:polyphosphate kinase